MQLYDMRFEKPSHLHLAFEIVSDARNVASCVVKPEGRRIRFLAPAREGNRLMERIYLNGGLVWCSQHRLEEPDARTASEPPTCSACP